MVRCLVTVTDPTDCACGFMSAERVSALLGTPKHEIARSFPDQQLAIFPDITFTCSGEVVRWIMGGTFRNLGGESPELQIWRPLGDSVYQKVNSTFVYVLSDEPDSVYEYTVDPPLPFQPGDILGVFHPDSRDVVLELDYDRESTSVYYTQYSSVIESGNSLFDLNGENVKVESGTPLVSAAVGKG